MKTSTVFATGAWCLLLAQSLACGDYSSTAAIHKSSDAPSNFSATINGAPWQGTLATTIASAGNSGTYQVSSVSSGNIGLLVFMTNIRGPGTYALGMSSSVTGGNGSVSNGLQTWTTPTTGAAGTVTLTTVSTTKIVGTFSFVAALSTDGIPSTKTVTGGSFDLDVKQTGTSPEVPEQLGGNVTGTLSGSPWNGSTIVLDTLPTIHVLSLYASNLDYSIEFDISGFAGVGNYDLNTGTLRMGRIIIRDGTQKAWGGTAELSSGHFTVTSATSKRIVGSGTMTLQPDPNTTATGIMTFTGTFDAGYKQ